MAYLLLFTQQIYMSEGTIIAYSATTISTMARFVFMYLLYTRKSTNPYSLLFSVMNIVSSSMWITYSQIVDDTPLFVRGTSDLFLHPIEVWSFGAYASNPKGHHLVVQLQHVVKIAMPTAALSD